MDAIGCTVCNQFLQFFASISQHSRGRLSRSIGRVCANAGERCHQIRKRISFLYILRFCRSHIRSKRRHLSQQCGKGIVIRRLRGESRRLDREIRRFCRESSQKIKRRIFHHSRRDIHCFGFCWKLYILRLIDPVTQQHRLHQIQELQIFDDKQHRISTCFLFALLILFVKVMDKLYDI